MITEEPQEQQAELLFYVNDHLNTPQQLLDRAGVVRWSAVYTPFGEARVNPNSTVTQNLRFAGQYYDEETELHYNWNRYYDPERGRYTTSDPIGLAGGLNTYLYANGNPVRYVDPEGLVWTAGQAGVSWDEFQEINNSGTTAPECVKQCLAEIIGFEEAATAGGIAATAPLVPKHRGGISGGGPAGDSTSVVSTIAGKTGTPGKRSAVRSAIRGAGRIGSRFLPGLGAGLTAVDIALFKKCIEATCNDCEKNE